MHRIALFALLAMLCISGRAASQTFTVTNSGATDYLLNGQPDPALTLRRGRTYVFNVNATGHPFYIKTIPGTGTVNAYSNGVTGNGATGSAVTFVVPSNAPDQLFYHCSVHAAMGSTISIIDAVPAVSRPGLVALVLLVGATGLFAVRRRGAQT